MSRLLLLFEALVARAERAEQEFVRLGERRHAALAAAMQVGRSQGIAGIARFLGIATQSALKTVAELERDGYVHRLARDPSLGASRFGTIHSIIVTHEGIALLAALEDLDRSVEDRLLASLTPEERASFIALADRVATAD